MTTDFQSPTGRTAGASLSEKLSDLRKKAFAHLLTGLGNGAIGYLLVTYASDISASLGFLPEWLVAGAGYVSAGVGALYILLSVLSAIMLAVARTKLAGLPSEALDKDDAGES